jgi:hypothetical protein
MSHDRRITLPRETIFAMQAGSKDSASSENSDAEEAAAFCLCYFIGLHVPPTALCPSIMLISIPCHIRILESCNKICIL